MKRFLLLTSALCTLAAAYSQSSLKEEPAQPGANPLALNVEEYDFGRIPQGKPVYYSFEIKNQGAEILVINNVNATCGCTTPEWNREPLAPGATDRIRVGYNAAAEGYFEKYITIVYNQNHSKQIKIKGTVWKAPAGSAPANSSVQFLKQQIQ